MSNYYDLVRDNYREIATADLDTVAGMVADEIRDPYAEGEYPRDEDGMVDLYTIAEAVQRFAKACVREVDA